MITMVHYSLQDLSSRLLMTVCVAVTLGAQGSCMPVTPVAEAAEAAAANAPAPPGAPLIQVTAGAAPLKQQPSSKSDHAQASVGAKPSQTWSPPVFRPPVSPLEGILALPPGTLPPVELTPTGDLGVAVRDLKRGDLPGARREVEAYLEGATSSHQKLLGIFVRAHIEEAEGAHKRAAASYASIRGGDRGLAPEIARGEGRARLAAGEPIAGARRLQSAADSLPEGAHRDRILVEAAKAFLEGGHPVTASKILEDTLTRASGSFQAQLELTLAQAKLLRGHKTEANKSLKHLWATATDCEVVAQSRQLLLEQRSPYPATSLSRELQRVERMTACKQFDEAEAHLKSLQGQADKDALEEGWLRLWYARWDLDQLDSYTQTRLNEKLSDLTRARISRWAAKAAWRKGEPGRAADLRLASIAARGSTPSTQDNFAVGLLYAEAHQFDKARALLEGVLAQRVSRHKRIESMWYLAWGATLEGRHAEAKRRYTELVERYGKENRGKAAMYWLGRLALKGGDHQAALGWFRRLSEESPDSFYTFLIKSLRLDQAASPTVAAQELTPKVIKKASPELPQGAAPGAGLIASLPPTGKALPLALPASSPLRTAFPSIPEITSTPFLDLPSPLRPAPPVDLTRWKAQGAADLKGLVKVYGSISPELRIAGSLARAGFTSEAGSWLVAARSEATGASDPKLKRLSTERTSLYSAFWYVDQPLQALRSDPTGWPFPRFDLANPETTEAWKRRYPRVYADAVSRAHFSWGVDPSLIYGIMRTESMFGTEQVSGVGARGLMQIMPATGQAIADIIGEPFQVDDLHRPEQNVWYGSWYLSQLLDRFNGQLPIAVAAYNAGPTYVSTWVKRSGEVPIDVFIEEIPIRQTRDYVKKVLRAMSLYRALYANSELLPLRANVDPTIKDGVDF